MKLIIAAASLLVASAALADARSPDQAYMPVDTLNAQGSVEGNSFPMTVKIVNPNHGDVLICDAYAEALAGARGSSTRVKVTKYVKGAVIETFQENEVRFEFQNRNFGVGFLPSRKSARVYASCLPASTGNDSGAGTCDPRSPGQDGKHCNTTCQAKRTDPSQCASPNPDQNPWHPNPNEAFLD